MKISTRQVLKILYVLAWIIFIGVCIEAGGFIFNVIFTLAINPIGAKYFWQQVDLSALYNYDIGFFVVMTFFSCLVSVLRAIMFYLIVKKTHDKTVTMTGPFTDDVVRFVLQLSFWALLIGLFSAWGAKYSEWLAKKGIDMPDIQYLRLAGADVWLFMAVILFLIAQVIKRGIEIQTENELTV